MMKRFAKVFAVYLALGAIAATGVFAFVKLLDPPLWGHMAFVTVMVCFYFALDAMEDE